MPEVIPEPLQDNDREQFIPDNQRALNMERWKSLGEGMEQDDGFDGMFGFQKVMTR